MWYNNDFGENTEGGGFLNSTANQADTPSKKGTPRRIQSVLPVVVSQIKDCPDEEFKLFGMPAQILHLVGLLKDYEVQSTKATYRIEDHTGEIKAVWWLESDDANTPNLPPVKEGHYVEVFGSLRNQDGEKIIMVLRMFLVDDCNKITNHLLQVIRARLAAEKSSQNSDIMIKANNPGAALANSMSFMDTDVGQEKSLGLTHMQDKVFRILQTDKSQAGMERSAVLRQFPTAQHREVNEALEFLNNEGHAYSTVDNDHFKATDN